MLLTILIMLLGFVLMNRLWTLAINSKVLILPSGWQLWLMSALQSNKSWAFFRSFLESPEKATVCKGDMLARPPLPPRTSAFNSSNLLSTSLGAPKPAAKWIGQSFAM